MFHSKLDLTSYLVGFVNITTGFFLYLRKIVD